MKIHVITGAIALLTALTFTSCQKDDDKKPENPGAAGNPTEIITTVRLVLTEEGTSSESVFEWKDADGDGPGVPQVGDVTLKPGKTYEGHLLLLDESKSPVDTISNEVEEEHNAHQFFYYPAGTSTAPLTVTKLDVDDHNLPVGLKIRVQTSATATDGSLRIVLKHYDGVDKSNDPAIGETDVDVTYPVVIQ